MTFFIFFIFSIFLSRSLCLQYYIGLPTVFFIFIGIILLLTLIVFVIACRMGGDTSTGVSRALGFLFYTLISLQIVAQIGTASTGFEARIVLRLYWWLSVISSVDVSESVRRKKESVCV